MPLTASLSGIGKARVALGAVFLLRTTPLLAPFHVAFLADTAPLLGWPDGHAHFVSEVPGLRITSMTFLAALCLARTLAAVAFMIGWRARAAGYLAGGLGYLTVLQDPTQFYTTYHVIFLGTLLLASTDAVSSCAVAPAKPRSPASSIWLIRGWVASIYFWAGIAKIRPDWWDGRTLALLAREGLLRPSVSAALLANESGRALVGGGTIAVELGLCVLLLLGKTRAIALLLAVAFHLVLEWATAPDLFGWAMIALLLSFMEPHDFQRVRRRFRPDP